MGRLVSYTGRGCGYRRTSTTAAADCKALTDGAYSISRLAASDIYCHRCSCTTRRLLNRVEKSPFPKSDENIPPLPQQNHHICKKSYIYVSDKKVLSPRVDAVITIVTWICLQAGSRHLVLLGKSDATVLFITCTRHAGPKTSFPWHCQYIYIIKINK